MNDTNRASDRPATVFVAGPFFKLIDPATGRLPPDEQRLVETLIDHFEKAGARVYNAHKREAWGAELMEPMVFTKLDFDQIAASDLIVIRPGSPASLGTHIELGWASALGKPMVVLLDEGGEYCGMVHGLGALVPTATLKLVDRKVDLAALHSAVVEVMGRTRVAA